jgi:AraC family transcriptional activator FtrA
MSQHRVVALVRPVQSTFELGCAAEVFGLARPGVPQHYEFEICAEHPGPVLTSAGYAIEVPSELSALDSADTVIIPGWLPVEAPLPPAVHSALLRAHGRGARIVTICSGVYALARTGLLDGRSAVTHWAQADRFRKLFPEIVVEVDQLYVDHGDVATSGGAGAGLELCLHLVRKDHGHAHAARVAQHMVIPPDRSARGDRLPPCDRSCDRSYDFRTELARLADRLDEVSGVRDLAEHFNVSPRTLARRFEHELGLSPGAWLLSRRIAWAQRLLEDTDLPVDSVAARVGLGSAVNLRRRFRRLVGGTPSEYRQATRSSGPAALTSA